MDEDRFEKKYYKAGPAWLEAAVQALTAAGVVLIAPVRGDDGQVEFAPVTAASQIAPEFDNTRLPLKALFLPQTEVLLRYKNKQDGDTEMLSGPQAPPETVVLGCRPCDAASLALIDSVFNWDYEDAPYRDRRNAATIVSVACPELRPGCFCEAVGGGPDCERGSDVLVRDSQGGATLTVLSEKGQRFVERLGATLHPCGAGVSPANCGAGVSPANSDANRAIDLARVKAWLDDNFDSAMWEEFSLACRGCGACSYLCPTCHCFDIVDEASWNHGERRRNWDCCAYKLFTLHASGHNPRPNQTARWRQRVMHKFKYFPDRFGAVACVGCGRCAARCTAGQSMHDILARIQLLPQQEKV